MKYVLGSILLIALVVWIVHNVRAIIKMRKKKKEGKNNAYSVDRNADSVAGEEAGEDKSSK